MTTFGMAARLATRCHQGLLTLGCLVLSVMLVGCNADKLVEVAAPTGRIDPEALKTGEGAELQYNMALTSFNTIFMRADDSFLFLSGAFSDELSGNFQALQATRRDENAAQRFIDVAVYRDLHKARLNIEQATGALQRYAPLKPKALIGQMFSLGGFVVEMLGDAYCSGTPLSTAVFEGDIIYGEPLTTEKIHQNALARFDSALGYSADSARMLNLARVGRGRALLNMARFAEAAAAVQDVPTSFQYLVRLGASGDDSVGAHVTNVVSTAHALQANFNYGVQDREGGNGLDYVSANDPRVGTRLEQSNGVTRSVPTKYPERSSPIPLADGIEARLIEAEAALRANDIATWTAKLNALRATCDVSNPACPGSIPPLTADSTTTANAALRVDVMFRERAFWLFLTGHRMGDMRRLVRQYNREPGDVFPVGTIIFDNEILGTYGSDVNFSPTGELGLNPKYTGCLDRQA